MAFFKCLTNSNIKTTMNEQQQNNNTLSTYLGHEFQQKLMWQLLVEPEFAQKTLPNLSTEYFDDINLKRLFIIIMEYLNEFGRVPNLQNKSIYQAINLYKTPGNVVEEEILLSTIERIKLWNEKVLNGVLMYDGEDVQKATNKFIKQQEYRKLAEYIITNTKRSDAKNEKHLINEIEGRIEKINSIGDEEDYGINVFDNLEQVLEPDFRQPIPTGIEVLDAVTGGGLGKGEIGMALIPSGHGKTTLLTKIANTAYEIEKNVLQIYFEDTEKEIQRKHFTLWSKIPLSEIDNNTDFVSKRVTEKHEEIGGRGKLVIKKFSQDGTTMQDVRNWIIKYQKKYGFKFDIIVLDYLDCLDSNKITRDQNESELSIVKSFLAMASDFNVPCWTAIQTNRCLSLKTIVNIEGVGKTEIGNVKVNDNILTAKGYRKITEVFPITKQQTYKIKTKSGKEIICSKNHEFITANNMLLSIKNGLSVGDKLMVNMNNMVDNIELFDDNIESIELHDVEDTIDITVDDTHMFFANDIYTHNSGFSTEAIDATHSGGSIKRIQKSHFFMSVAKPDKHTPLANINILKARFAQDGQAFKDCIFNNDTMEIRITDQYNKYSYRKMREGGKFNEDLARLNEKLSKVKQTQEGLVYDTQKQMNSNTNFELDLHKEISKNLPPINGVIGENNINNKVGDDIGFISEEELNNLGVGDNNKPDVITTTTNNNSSGSIDNSKLNELLKNNVR